MNKSVLLPWILALALMGSQCIDWGSTILDFGRGRTYKYIRHRSQKKRRILARRGSVQ